MVEVVYRVLFNNKPATRCQLDRVEEITVEQQQDKAWQASLVIPICVDAQGRWSGEDEDFLASFTRVRVEVKINNKSFVPLIDGTIAGVDTQMDSGPGKSSITVVVHDDSVYLNRVHNVETFDGKSNHEMAEYLFKQIPEIGSTEIDATPPRQNDLSSTVVKRGTAMQILKMLATCQNIQVYVLPGSEPGRSIGMFKAPSTEPSGLTPLLLLGKERNVMYFSVKYNALNPVKAKASRLNLKDKTVRTETSSSNDLELLGEEKPFTDESALGEEELSPYTCPSLDLKDEVSALAARSAIVLQGQGRVLGTCYPDVLQPYKVIDVIGTNGRLSGPYMITKVTHRLTRNGYVQDFSVKRNAFSRGTGSAGPTGGNFNPSINVVGSVL
jgi:hypothetical protein